MKRHMTMVVSMIALLFSTQVSAQDIEPNDVITDASSMALNGSVTGDIYIDPATDASDYYEVVLDDDGTFSATFTPEAGLNAYVIIYRKNGSQIANQYASGPGTITASVSCLGTDIPVSLET